ncbi:MAG: phosphodiester glycosidase family protein, partial [Bacteroidales bacterium]|nr:phosphodiester glycosidase family protein [Bacteroidales bacterium]
TRAVFLQHEDGTYEAAWSYYKSSTEHWVYQQPADNSYAKDPLQAPSATFPVKGEQLEAVNGIGGGPVLIKGGEIKNTYIEEMYDSGGINPTSPNNPRTAIGITSENHLVLFACEGREQTEGVVGFTTEELANILLDYGCVEAINLDGGGSSMMLVCGKELFKPSDGNQRKVGSCIYIK